MSKAETPVKGEVQTPRHDPKEIVLMLNDPDSVGRALPLCVATECIEQLVADRKMLMDGMNNALNIIAQGPQLKAIQCPNCTGTPIPGSVLAGFTINDRQETGMCRCHNCGHRWQSITEDGRITELEALLASLKSRP